MSHRGRGASPSNFNRGNPRRKLLGSGRHPLSYIKVDFGALQIPYSDDEADLELKSEDGVIFKVQAFYLKAASGVFRAMLTTSAARITSKCLPIEGSTIGTPTTVSQPPIEISSPSLVVRLFLDLAYHGPILSSLAQTPPLIPDPPASDSQTPPPPGLIAAHPTPPLLNISPPFIHFTDIFRAANAPYRGPGKEVACLSALLELLDRFDCGVGMRDRALTHFEPSFRTDPWGVFCIAAKYEDVPLAKKAIAKFIAIRGGARANVDLDTILPLNVKQVSIEWWMGYERAFRRISRSYKAGEQYLPANIEAFWNKVAAAFLPAPSVRVPNSATPGPGPVVTSGALDGQGEGDDAGGWGNSYSDQSQVYDFLSLAPVDD